MKNMYEKYNGNWYLPVLKKILELYQTDSDSFSEKNFNSYLLEELNYIPSKLNMYIDKKETKDYFDEESYQKLIKIAGRFESWFINTHEERRINNKLEKHKNSGIEEKSRRLIEEFIQNEYTIEEFTKVKEIDSSEFQRALKVVGSCDLELYNQYSSLQLERNKKRFRLLSVSLQEIAFLVNDGISLDDNTTRRFDLIDYYQRTSLNTNQLIKVLNNISLTSQEKRTILSFISKFKRDQPLDISSTLESTVEINLKRDEQGNLIPGSGRIVTRQEKQSIIDWIKENNLPCTRFLYRDAFNRYKKGQLFKSEKQNNSNKKI